MPGLIDNHWHATLIRVTPAQSLGDVGYSTLLAGDEATDTLMRGFTTVRDVGGPVFSLKRAIDEGIVKGPRIYPSGAVITVTSGHGDFRQLTDLPRTIGGMLHRMEQLGGSMVADSPDEVRLRVREQLMQGASQIKLTAGGGVSSPFSPIDVTTFTEAELRAAVEAAENWGTYVTVHAFTPAAIQRAIAAGVKCIEHGMLMDDASAKLIAEKGIWLSMQPIPEALGKGLSGGFGPAREGGRGLARHTQDLRVGEEVQAQDGVGYRCAVLSRAGAATRGNSGLDGPMVHPRRNADHGDIDKRRTAGAVRQAQSLSRQARRRGAGGARRPTPGRRQSAGEHQPRCGSRQEFPRHHEGWQDLQKRIVEVRICLCVDLMFR